MAAMGMTWKMTDSGMLSASGGGLQFPEGCAREIHTAAADFNSQKAARAQSSPRSRTPTPRRLRARDRKWSEPIKGRGGPACSALNSAVK